MVAVTTVLSAIAGAGSIATAATPLIATIAPVVGKFAGQVVQKGPSVMSNMKNIPGIGQALNTQPPVAPST